MAGGYRTGSGRSKHGYYNEIYCGSSYELAWVVFQIDHGLKFERFNGCVVCPETGKRYFPDFLQDGKIIEIKGFEKQESVDIKNRIAEANGFDVVVLRKPDLKDILKYAEQKFGTKRIYEHYDNYKPQFVYQCHKCNKEFGRARKITTEKKYCSRACSLSGNRKPNRIHEYEWTEIECVICQQKVKTTTREIERGKKYCSCKCSRRGQIKNRSIV